MEKQIACIASQVVRDDGDTDWIAAAVGIDATRLGIDPLSSTMLADVPHLIRRHLDVALQDAGPDATLHSVLVGLYESLKTRIHVAAISPEATLSATDADKASASIMQSAGDLLSKSLQSHRTPPSTRRWQPRVAPVSLLKPTPDRASWSPRRAGSAALSA